MLLFTASAHFGSMKADLIRMVPRRIRNPGAIVYLVAVFPANVRADQQRLTLRCKPATPLWLRAPMQLLFIGLTWWSGILQQ
jgi:uncharacterized membrane protein